MTGTTDALRTIHNADWQTPWEVEFMTYKRPADLVRWACIPETGNYTAPLDPNEAPMMVDAQADLDDARDARFNRPYLPLDKPMEPPRDWLGAVMGLTVLALLAACVWAVQ